VSARFVIALGLSVFGVVLAILGFIALRGGVEHTTAKAEPGTGVSTALGHTAAAHAPFRGLTEARLGLDDRCLHVLVADTDSERHEGLRGVTDFAGYDGMLFVYDSDSLARYTMSGTPTPLDIGWYAADGSPVDHTTMTPCLDGNDATCPIYASEGSYRYALETAAGQGGTGSIGACPA
jgi:uncharacterized membrane protein (UPF0127 family)